MKKKKKKLWKIIAAVVVVILLLFVFLGKGGSNLSIYNEETVKVRDIITYNKFSGNIVAAEDKDVVAEASAKVLTLNIEEGDEVKKGDVLAVLDASTLEYNIAVKEKSMDITDLTNMYNKRDAQKAYNDYKTGIESGENPQLLSAQTSLNNARTSLENSQKNYHDAVAGMEDGSTLAAAHNAAIRANEAVSQAQKAYDDNEAEIVRLQSLGITATGGNASLVQAQLEVLISRRASLYSALASAKSAASSAYNAYVSSSDNLEDAIEQYKTAMDSAQTAYDSAQKNFEATVTQVNQTLEGYANALEKTVALASTEISMMELEHMYDQLEDYTIIAPMDGIITTLTAKEGSMVSAGMTIGKVTNFDVMEIEIKIDEYDILGVEVGTAVDVSVDALEVTFPGKIAKISKQAMVSGGVSYFIAKVEFDADETVRSGMSVEVKMVSRNAPQSVSVSTEAIRTAKDNTRYVLMRGVDGKEFEQPVSVGVSDGNYVQITEGLSEGDVVLVIPRNYMYEMMMGY